jgi:hypothetical protein
MPDRHSPSQELPKCFITIETVLIIISTAPYESMRVHPHFPWLLLIISLPGNGATARMRIWRALEVLGCAAIRDGACSTASITSVPRSFASAIGPAAGWTVTWRLI